MIFMFMHRRRRQEGPEGERPAAMMTTAHRLRSAAALVTDLSIHALNDTIAMTTLTPDDLIVDSKETVNLERRMFIAVTNRNREMLKRQGVTLNDGETQSSLLGCTPTELLTHIRSTYYADIEDSGYGTVWAIDHDKPLARANLSDPDTRKEVLHYTNLQAMFVTDNTSKGAHGRITMSRLLPKPRIPDKFRTSDGRVDTEATLKHFGLA